MGTARGSREASAAKEATDEATAQKAKQEARDQKEAAAAKKKVEEEAEEAAAKKEAAAQAATKEEEAAAETAAKEEEAAAKAAAKKEEAVAAELSQLRAVIRGNDDFIRQQRRQLKRLNDEIDDVPCLGGCCCHECTDELALSVRKSAAKARTAMQNQRTLTTLPEVCELAAAVQAAHITQAEAAEREARREAAAKKETAAEAAAKEEEAAAETAAKEEEAAAEAAAEADEREARREAVARFKRDLARFTRICNEEREAREKDRVAEAAADEQDAADQKEFDQEFLETEAFLDQHCRKPDHTQEPLSFDPSDEIREVDSPAAPRPTGRILRRRSKRVTFNRLCVEAKVGEDLDPIVKDLDDGQGGEHPTQNEPSVSEIDDSEGGARSTGSNRGRIMSH